MRATLKTSIALSLAALTVCAGLTATTSPAAAWPIIQPKIPFKPIPLPKFGPGPMPHHFHHGFGPWAAAGLFGVGLAAAAAASAQDPCVEYRPVYDGLGNYLGRTAVNVCQ